MSAVDASAAMVERLTEVRRNIALYAQRYGRSPLDVRLVAVSKQHPPAAIAAALAAGQHDFGESYAQEALEKMATLREHDITWHFIGHLQANKTRAIAENFQWVHTIERERIAQRLNDQRPHYAAPLQVCIQVSLAAEPGKAGVPPQEVARLAAQLSDMPRLRLRGLMCIPPATQDRDRQLRYFQQLRALRDQLNAQGFALDTLSMGMSNDMEAAIAAGATWVRIGTAIFGERSYTG